MAGLPSPTVRRPYDNGFMVSRTVAGVICAAALGAQTPAWIVKSNAHTQVLLDALSRTSPEAAALYGVEGVDEEISDLKPGFQARNRRILEEALDEMRRRLGGEQDRLVRQDLEILIDAAELSIEQSLASEKLLVPYFDVSRVVFYSAKALLDDRVAASRHPAALVRLRRYAGMESGYEPITRLAMARFAEGLEAGLTAPFRGEVEKNLADSEYLLNGIGPLFEKYGVGGYQDALATFRRQAAEFNDQIRARLLPRTREDFRLPPQLYALQLRDYGVDIPPLDLANQARGSFREIQLQMRDIAARLAAERGLPSKDYRDVIRELKKLQLADGEIMPHYRRRLAQIEEIVRRENLVTLPRREAAIRLASEAESAALPAPHMSPPRLIGNTGEKGEFVLPLRVPGEKGELQGFDDFTFDAASWTLTAHEARPGHEMQFAQLVEAGVSIARAIFAFNSTNVEGWALYTESLMKPYMPLDGQLISLQHRLMRAARAFLDPELQAGKVKPEEAMRVLTEDVVLSGPMARQEVERYTFRMPGQATSYYYGYSRMIELRSDVQKALGPRFDLKAFHDFVLAQGLLPPKLLRRTVFDGMVPRDPGAAASPAVGGGT